MSIGGDGVRIVGKIDIEKYRGITSDILTDEVILTDKSAGHINERRKGTLDKYIGYFARALFDPDTIFKDSKNENTALVCKRIDVLNGKSILIVLKLALRGDGSDYKNSIITVHELDKTKYRQYLRTKKIVYKSD